MSGGADLTYQRFAVSSCGDGIGYYDDTLAITIMSSCCVGSDAILLDWCLFYVQVLSSF